MNAARLSAFLLFLFLAPAAMGADWAGLQAAMLSFIDVETLATNTMDMCEGTDLTDQERDKLRTAFRSFREEHLPHKEEIRQAVISVMKKQGADGGDWFKAFQDPGIQKGITEQFLTEQVKGARGYCAIIFLEMLNGKRMALNFKDYAMQIQEYGNLKVFSPKIK